MRTQMLLLALVGLVIAASLGMGSLPLRADDGDEGPAGAGAGDVWVYDVLVVRVDPRDAGTAEQPLPFPTDGQTTVEVTRAAALQALKARGTTTLVMDTRLTVRAGRKATAREDNQTPILAPNNEDKNNLQFRSQVIRQGCQVDLIGGEGLDFSVEVRGAVVPPTEKRPPVQYVVGLQVSHDDLRHGRVLVLHHRKQYRVHAGAGAPAGQRAIEHYVFLRGTQRGSR